LGRWVVRNACREAAGWPKDTTVSINVSARQMHDPGLVDEVRAALQTSGLAPERLILEITESVAMGEGEEITARMRALKDLGVLIAIDDFGTGYSSLASLQRMPVDVLKIDRSFVEDLASRPERQVLVGLILEMARALNLKAVAEGIETPAQRALLFELDCQYGQGFLFAKPVPAAILLDLPEAMPA
jgi:EAL domain-containing protein (putative c-di-GMP-specific phosphodiesterase class I)